VAIRFKSLTAYSRKAQKAVDEEFANA
jgi:hypothetical protein